MKRFFIAICLPLTLLISSINIIADENHKHSPGFTEQELSTQVSVLFGKGGNIGVLSGKQGVLLIDNDYRVMSNALSKTLDKFGGHEKVRYVINTHYHGDHTGNNQDFGLHAMIVAHENVRKRLLTETEIKLFKMKSEPYAENAFPSVTFNQRLTLHINGENVELLHFANGHTDGDAVVFFKKANIVHMGDHYFNGMFPFVDVDNGGNVEQLAANIAQVLDMIDDKTQIIPGHGPIANKAELAAWQKMLVGTANEVKAMKVEGLNLNAMQDEGLSDQWVGYSKGFINEATWVMLVNNSLDKH